MGSTLTVDNIVGATTAANVKLPAGCILQVLEGSFDTQTNIASSSYTDTSLTVTITPKFASSKVYVITNLHMYINGTGLLGLNVLRGSTQIVEAQKAVGFADNTTGVAAITKLDSPSTTSATTYKVQVKYTSLGGGSIARINQQNGGSRITVMEVAG